MNRFKKELRRKGIKLEHDYPWLPFYVKGKSCFDPGNICIEAVIVKSETASVSIVTNVMTTELKVSRKGDLEEIHY